MSLKKYLLGLNSKVSKRIKRNNGFVIIAKIMIIATTIALIAIGINQLVQETQSQELYLTGVELKDKEGDWNIIDNPDEEILLDESWLINLNRVFNADEIRDIEIAKDDQLIPVEVKKYPEQKKIIVTPENYYLADESYTLNISLDNQNKYKMYFDTVGEDSGLIPVMPLPEWPKSGREGAPYPPPTSIFITTPDFGEWNEAWREGEEPAVLRQTNATHLLHFGGVAWGTDPDFKEPFQHNMEIVSDFDLRHIAWVPGWSVEGSEDLDPEDEEKLEGEHCIDIDGDPIGFYPSEELEPWQCIHSSAWRDYRLKTAKRTLDWGGADNIALDEWLGDYSVLNHSDGCFNEYSMEGFRKYLKQKYTTEELQSFGIDDINTFDYGNFIRDEYLSTYKNNRWDVPLRMDFEDFQMSSALKVQDDLIEELRDYAGAHDKEIYFAANTPELMPDQLVIQSKIDYLSAEIGFDLPPEARSIPYYKVGTSMGKPLFAHPKCHHEPTEELMTRPDLAELWKIYTAEAYSARGFLQVPANYHLFWIDEPTMITADLEALRPYYNFISSNEQFFESNISTSRIAVLLPYPSLRWSDYFRHGFYGTNNLLLDTHFQYDVLFAGDDDWIEDELSQKELDRYQTIILPNTTHLTDAQVDLILSYVESGGRILGFGDIGTHNEYYDDVYREPLQDLSTEGVQQYGEGWFAYMEGNPGYDYYNERPNLTRNEFAEQLNALIEPNILTDANENVAIQKYWSVEKQAYVIHLINYNYDLDAKQLHPQDNIDLEVLLNDQLDDKELEVYYASPDWEKVENLSYEISEERIKIQVPDLEIYGVLYIGEKRSFELE